MTVETFLNGRVTLHCGDSREVLKGIPDCSIDSVVCDPPYALVSIVKRFGAGGAPVRVPEGGSGAYARASAGFMGKTWDTGETAFAATFWAECLRVLKPGGHVVAFSGTRTVHRMVCAIEDAGFEIRDSLQWLYGSGFPKSHDVSKELDKKAGHWRGRAGEVKIAEQVAKGAEYIRGEKGDPITQEAIQWQGWGTALKPAVEPICLARKPLVGTVARNVLEHGTGAININGCRVGTDENLDGGGYGGGNRHDGTENWRMRNGGAGEFVQPIGRWPANVIHDGSAEVLAAFPETTVTGVRSDASKERWSNAESTLPGQGGTNHKGIEYPGDSTSAARFFYTAKADANDRLGSKHPTVKPVDLMQWLCRLVTPRGGTVLDPFAGTGTTGEAAFREGFNAVLIERETEYQADIRRRMALVMSGPEERKRESIKAKLGSVPFEAGSLFSGLEAS
jgi:site-specific DNA-methyltransferase (adenine-specific)